MLKAIRVSAMLLAFVGSAHAGEILTPPAPQLPMTYTVQESSVAVEGTTETTDTMTQIMLTVLVSLLP